MDRGDSQDGEGMRDSRHPKAHPFPSLIFVDCSVLSYCLFGFFLWRGTMLRVLALLLRQLFSNLLGYLYKPERLARGGYTSYELIKKADLPPIASEAFRIMY